MKASLRALLTGLIDYAGLFPPAQLPFADAVANYQRYRSGADGWMMGRFVCPTGKLKDVPADVPCSALGRGGATAEAFLEGVAADVADIQASASPVEVLETKLPARLVAEWEALADLLKRAVDLLKPTRLQAVFFEAPILEPKPMRSFFHLLVRYDHHPRMGFKLRAGGLEAAAFPTAEQVARGVFYGLADALPIKATAGLHHPLPRFDPTVPARMHGFINLFLAGILWHVRDFPEATLAAILNDENPANFVFTDAEARWGEYAIPTDQIAEARKYRMTSFGSCSFDEPRDDLRALGWM